MKRFIERCVVMFTPFVSSFLYVIHTFMLKEGVSESIFYGYNSNTFGHSIFWLYLVLIRSKSMCKWYKLSIKLSMAMNFMNILYYHKLISWIGLLDIALSFSIASIICWLIFISAKKVSKSINQACKHSRIK